MNFLYNISTPTMNQSLHGYLIAIIVIRDTQFWNFLRVLSTIEKTNSFMAIYSALRKFWAFH